MYRRKEAPKLVDAVLLMNEAGVSRLRRYVNQHHPREDFDRNVEIIRYAARFGYAACGDKFSISRQRVHQIVMQYRFHALDAMGEL